MYMLFLIYKFLIFENYDFSKFNTKLKHVICCFVSWNKLISQEKEADHQSLALPLS